MGILIVTNNFATHLCFIGILRPIVLGITSLYFKHKKLQYDLPQSGFIDILFHCVLYLYNCV